MPTDWSRDGAFLIYTTITQDGQNLDLGYIELTGDRSIKPILQTPFVLPESLRSDPERLARFRRETKAAASLNHPNIATIHSIEEPRITHQV